MECIVFNIHATKGKLHGKLMEEVGKWLKCHSNAHIISTSTVETKIYSEAPPSLIHIIYYEYK